MEEEDDDFYAQNRAGPHSRSAANGPGQAQNAQNVKPGFKQEETGEELEEGEEEEEEEDSDSVCGSLALPQSRLIWI
jgi:hypothetical protein